MKFEFNYQIDLAQTDDKVELWFPVPQSNEVQVITSDGQNLGILNLNEAINKAKNEGLDLIEIAPNAKPPVCKIMDMGKFKYDQQKKANKAKKKTKEDRIKRN